MSNTNLHSPYSNASNSYLYATSGGGGRRSSVTFPDVEFELPPQYNAVDWNLTNTTNTTLAVQNKPAPPDLTGKVDRTELKQVAFTADYNDLLNKPVPAAANTQTSNNQYEVHLYTRAALTEPVRANKAMTFYTYNNWTQPGDPYWWTNNTNLPTPTAANVLQPTQCTDSPILMNFTGDPSASGASYTPGCFAWAVPFTGVWSIQYTCYFEKAGAQPLGSSVEADQIYNQVWFARVRGPQYANDNNSMFGRAYQRLGFSETKGHVATASVTQVFRSGDRIAPVMRTLFGGADDALTQTYGGDMRANFEKGAGLQITLVQGYGYAP